MNPHAELGKNKNAPLEKKTRYMIFNGRNIQETNLVKLGNTYIERVWSKGNKKSFKLVGIMIDEKLKWDEHINYINRKVGYANYMLAKASKTLGTHNKKLLYSGLTHSHCTIPRKMYN